MYVLRAIKEQDLEAFVKLALQAGIGMTSIPKNREILLHKVRHAVQSYRKTVELPGDENYLFLLEELKTGKIIGSSGIEAKTGTVKPLTFYRQEKQEIPALLSTSQKTVSLLRVVHYYNAPSEICSLYLSPKFRREGLGKLLSLGRFHFMASHRHRFDQMLFAEMRGYINAENISPFWEGIGRHFLDIRFETLMHIRDEDTVDLSRILPAHPIYIPLLPQHVQKSIAQVHPATLNALNMLIQEGFKLTDEIDLFDGGPKIEAEVSEIRTVKTSKLAAVADIVEKMEASSFIVSNDCLDFRACYGNIRELAPQEIALNREAAEALHVSKGALVRYSELHHSTAEG